MDAIAIVLRSFLNAIFFIISYWWVYLPVLLIIGVIGIWRNYTETKYFLSLKWVLLELKPPPDVPQSPKVAENFFSGLHGVYARPVKGKKRFFEGKLQDWYSFEIVGNQGDVRFYVRTLESNRNIVETHLFAQYPGAEIALVDDYVTQLPEKLPMTEYDLFGAELVFTKNNGFPLKTYPFFEEEGGKDEYKRIDPLAPLAEAMSNLGPGEYMWLQYIARPTGDEWTKETTPEVNKLIGKKEEKKEENVLLKLFDTISGLLPFVPGKSEAEKKEEKEFSIQRLTSGQKFILDQIENKVAKLAFKVTPRFLYIAKKDVFNRARVTNVIGMFKQLYSNNLNSFKPNGETGTSADGFLASIFPSNNGFFKAQQEFERKTDIWNKYRWREFRSTVILSTEEMATLYHMPGLNIKAPFFPRVDAKKSQPPAGLPIK
jgi:hypothetical protein